MKRKFYTAPQFEFAPMSNAFNLAGETIRRPEAKPVKQTETKVYSVRCFAGDGSMIGSVLENAEGEPLTKFEAESRCRFETTRSERRKAQGLPGAFSFAVAAWIKETGQRII